VSINPRFRFSHALPYASECDHARFGSLVLPASLQMIVCLLLARRGLLYRSVCDKLAESLVCVERLNGQANALRHG
jgi:hypothetical protein